MDVVRFIVTGILVLVFGLTVWCVVLRTVKFGRAMAARPDHHPAKEIPLPDDPHAEDFRSWEEQLALRQPEGEDA